LLAWNKALCVKWLWKLTNTTCLFISWANYYQKTQGHLFSLQVQVEMHGVRRWFWG